MRARILRIAQWVPERQFRFLSRRKTLPDLARGRCASRAGDVANFRAMKASDTIRDRRSIKRFTDRPVTREEIETILAAATLAPNHKLTQPWRFYVLGPDARYAYGLALGNRKARKLEDPAAAGNAMRDTVAAEHRALPAMIAVAVVDNENPETREEDYAAGMMAMQNMSLVAVELGLGTHIKTGAVMSDPAARAAAGVRDGERIVAVLNVGTPAETPGPKKRELGVDLHDLDALTMANVDHPALTLDARSTALVIIDLQRGIVGARQRRTLDVAGDRQQSARIGRKCKDAGGLIVPVHVAFSPSGADRLQQPIDAPMVLPPGGFPADWADLVPEIAALDAEVVITKRQWSAFYGTELDLQLRRRGITTILLTGISTNFGVESTARDAWQHGYDVIVVEDACASAEAAMHQFAIEKILPRSVARSLDRGECSRAL